MVYNTTVHDKNAHTNIEYTSKEVQSLKIKFYEEQTVLVLTQHKITSC